MGESTEKRGLMDRLMGLTEKLSGPLNKFANTKVVSSIVSGLVSAMPIVMIGSIFLIVYVLGSPSVGTSGEPLIPFLEPVAPMFAWMNNVTLNLFALYTSVSIAISYGEKTGVEQKTAGLLGLGTFIVITIGSYDDSGGFSVSSWSASGLFVSMITSILSIKVYKWLVDKNITIKMPDSVPPNISNAFTSIIPYAACFSISWLVRVVIGFDIVEFLQNVLSPLISGTDNVFVAGFISMVTLLLWSVGLHGDNMFLNLFTPFSTIWINENAAALEAGASIYELPNVLAGMTSGLPRLTIWTASIWPLLFLMIISKRKELKTLGFTALVPGIFTIVEPVVFGLPVALNPYLTIPFVLSGTISTIVGYLLMSTSFFGKFFALVPWATPPFLLGPLGTGDWKTIFIPIVSFVIGLVIYLPFWRQYLSSLNKEDQGKTEETAAVS